MKFTFRIYCWIILGWVSLQAQIPSYKMGTYNDQVLEGYLDAITWNGAVYALQYPSSLKTSPLKIDRYNTTTNYFESTELVSPTVGVQKVLTPIQLIASDSNLFLLGSIKEDNTLYYYIYSIKHKSSQLLHTVTTNSPYKFYFYQNKSSVAYWLQDSLRVKTLDLSNLILEDKGILRDANHRVIEQFECTSNELIFILKSDPANPYQLLVYDQTTQVLNDFSIQMEQKTIQTAQFKCEEDYLIYAGLYQKNNFKEQTGAFYWRYHLRKKQIVDTKFKDIPLEKQVQIYTRTTTTTTPYHRDQMSRTLESKAKAYYKVHSIFQGNTATVTLFLEEQREERNCSQGFTDLFPNCVDVTLKGKLVMVKFDPLSTSDLILTLHKTQSFNTESHFPFESFKVLNEGEKFFVYYNTHRSNTNPEATHATSVLSASNLKKGQLVVSTIEANGTIKTEPLLDYQNDPFLILPQLNLQNKLFGFKYKKGFLSSKKWLILQGVEF